MPCGVTRQNAAARKRCISRTLVDTLATFVGCWNSAHALRLVVHERFGMSRLPIPSVSYPCALGHEARSLGISPLAASLDTRASDISAGDAEPAIAGEQAGSIPESFTWHWQNGWEVHYKRAQNEGAPPLLLLPGFGVGTFHFNRNMEELSKTHDVYSMDLLGQGKSWPTRTPTREDGLCYSVDTWTDQVRAFLRRVVGRPAYVVGNSLGGYIGVNLAANYPDMVLGLALLNATPFRAFREPRRRSQSRNSEFTASSSSSSSSSSSRDSNDQASLSLESETGDYPAKEKDWIQWQGGDVLGWDGTLPAPQGLFRFGAWYFDRMRDPRTVKSMLGGVYSNPAAIGEDLVSEIIAATERGPSNHDYGVGGHEAFTSIIFAPKVAMSFEAMIDQIKMPLALVYGREDPWVVPLWGHRIKRQRPETLYYEVSPSGHCPHHETPSTVNRLLAGWLAHAESGIPPPLSAESGELEIAEETGVKARATLIPDAQPRGAMQWLDTVAWNIARGRGSS